MKKRWMSLVLTVIMVLSLAGCGKSTELSSVSRDPATDDGTVWFDEEAVALAGSVRKAGMSEAELARADELRAMAIDALDCKREESRERPGSTELEQRSGVLRYGKSTGSSFQVFPYQTQR